MKYLLVLVIALVAVVAAEDEWKPITEKDTLKQFHEDCKQKSGITEEQLRKFRDLDYPDEQEVHAYFLCGAKKLGIFTDENGYEVDRVLSQLDGMLDDADDVRNIITNCIISTDKDSTPEAKAFHLPQCVVNSKLVEAWKGSKKNA